MSIMNCDEADLLGNKILTKKEISTYKNLRIPYRSTPEVSVAALWKTHREITQKVKAAIDAGIVKQKYDYAEKGSSAYVISDSLGDGVKGLLNHADGKLYDSKSSYYKAVKAAGCEVLGSDAPTEVRKEIKGNYDISKELKQAIQQHLR